MTPHIKFKDLPITINITNVPFERAFVKACTIKLQLITEAHMSELLQEIMLRKLRVDLVESPEPEASCTVVCINVHHESEPRN